MLLSTVIVTILITLPFSCHSTAKWHFQQFDETYSHEQDGASNNGPVLKRGLSSYQSLRDALLHDRFEKKSISYQDGDQALSAYVSYSLKSAVKRPVILVVHDSDGRDDFENGKADALARLGYVGFAVDLFGGVASNAEESVALAKPLLDDRPFLLKRLQLALTEAMKISVANQEKVGAIGFSFGGLGVLDMARAGWDLKGIVAFHGLIKAPYQHFDAPVKAKILIEHGYDDKITPPSAVHGFEEEMTTRKADWQVHMHSNTANSFTIPGANSTTAQYNIISERRSWYAMKKFFEDIFI